jgi:SAM-dependent methyltransferase
LFSASGWPENLAGQTILEAGSGAGRFTEILLSTGAEVFSFDYSSAVEANWSNNGNSSNLHLFQGDIYNIPLTKRSFDKVICLGVLQHTPDPEQAFKNLTRYLKPGGQIVIDIYRKDLISLLQWKYFLRPITSRLDKKFLYRIIEVIVPAILPVATLLRFFFGRIGSRIVPIAEYSHLGLPYDLNKQWAILDTFDMYSPSYDHPQTVATVERWFKEAGLSDVTVESGPNGIVGKGRHME